jgi:hypothetical protein
VADRAYFGAQIVLSLVTSHYDGIDLQAISEGFDVRLSDEEIDALEEEATSTTMSLARLVSLEAMVQASEEGKK